MVAAPEKTPSGRSRALRGQSLCWQVRRFHPWRAQGLNPERVGKDMREVIEPAGLADADRLFLRGPKEREIDAFGQGLGGELGRLVTGDYRFDNLRCQERQPHQSSDVGIC